MTEIGFIILGYLIGAIPTGYLFAKYIKGIDIRLKGSGNIGATNVSRILGKKLGALTLLIDAAKSFLWVYLCLLLGFPPFFVAIVAYSLLIGNCYSLFLKGKGGKGVSTSLGIYLAISPKLFLISILAYLLFWALTRISAVGSLALSLFVPIFAIREGNPFYLSLFVTMSLLIFLRHRKNIASLRLKICKNS